MSNTNWVIPTTETFSAKDFASLNSLTPVQANRELKRLTESNLVKRDGETATKKVGRPAVIYKKS